MKPLHHDSRSGMPSVTQGVERYYTLTRCLGTSPLDNCITVPPRFKWVALVIFRAWNKQIKIKESNLPTNGKIKEDTRCRARWNKWKKKRECVRHIRGWWNLWLKDVSDARDWWCRRKGSCQSKSVVMATLISSLSARVLHQPPCD